MRRIWKGLYCLWFEFSRFTISIEKKKNFLFKICVSSIWMKIELDTDINPNLVYIKRHFQWVWDKNKVYAGAQGAPAPFALPLNFREPEGRGPGRGRELYNCHNNQNRFEIHQNSPKILSNLYIKIVSTLSQFQLFKNSQINFVMAATLLCTLE